MIASESPPLFLLIRHLSISLPDRNYARGSVTAKRQIVALCDHYGSIDKMQHVMGNYCVCVQFFGAVFAYSIELCVMSKMAD